ncbi:MAG: CHAT domain-containing protein [Leptolyngbyaceae cyanobacterium]
MRTLRPYRILRFSSLIALTLSCCLLSSSLDLLHAAQPSVSDPTQLVQQGVEAYHDARYDDAIAHWEQALTHYPEDAMDRDRAIILENLARAYRQIGQPTTTLAYWQAVTAVYTSLQDPAQVGRALSEQAQAYSSLGQPLQAISLLCTEDINLRGSISPASQTLPDAARSNAIDVDGLNADSSETYICQPESAIALSQGYGTASAQVAALGSLGEAYRSMQNYDAALWFLQQGLAIAETLESTRYAALLHSSLGYTYRAQAKLSYQQATAALRSASGDEEAFHTAAQTARMSALSEFAASQMLASQATDRTIEIKALLGLIGVHMQTGDRTSAAALRDQAMPLLAQLAPNQETAYLALQLIKQHRPLADAKGKALTDATYEASRSQCQDIVQDDQTWALLQQADAIATRLANNRLKAFTQGEVGHFYECAGDYAAAREWTQKARLAASGDQVLALDTLYLWQWQMGRIYAAVGDLEPAIESYNQATSTLNRIRDEILASNQTLQFDFRDTIAPVYREMAAIQLSQVPSLQTETLARRQEARPQLKANPLSRAALPVTQVASASPHETISIRDALANIDNLQLAELQNYFGSDCLVPVTDRRLDDILGQIHDERQTDATTALISTLIFPDKTAVILTLPNQLRQLHWIYQSEDYFRETIVDFRNSLEDTANELEGYNPQLAQQLYREFITPFEPQLVANNIETLVFVHDGILRNIPMAALYDGDRSQYLMEQYAIAIAPSLQQTLAPAIAPSDRRALVLGLTQDPVVNGEGLGALPAVGREVKDVISLLPDSDLLLNEALTQANLQRTLAANAYPVLHIATHGQFGTEPSNTYLVMGDKEPQPAAARGPANNRLLRLGELDALIREGAPRDSPLELIVLSACQTASGDERSTLGLAGVTIRAGAESALASLWAVNDEATADLITYFYEAWQAGLSKADALRKAQQQVLKDPQYLNHPAYWAAFVLVGDWQ